VNDPRIAVGEPIDPADVTPVTPEEFMRERAGRWTTQRDHPEASVTGAWFGPLRDGDSVTIRRDVALTTEGEQILGQQLRERHGVSLQRPRVVDVVSDTLDELRRMRDEVRNVVQAPELTLAADGTIHVTWPEGARYALVSRELLDDIAAQLTRCRTTHR
jgi:hypothetical protein